MNKIQACDNRLGVLEARLKMLEEEFTRPEARSRRMEINAKILAVSEQIKIEQDCRDAFKKALGKISAINAPAGTSRHPKAPNATTDNRERQPPERLPYKDNNLDE